MRLGSLFPHPNVLPFLGQCVGFQHADFGDTLAKEGIMVPYYEHGSLRSFVNRFRAFIPRDWGVCFGTFIDHVTRE